MTDDATRDAVAAEQRALLAALAGGGPVPAGFDADRIALSGRTLLAKRRRNVARRWPALAAVPDFPTRFDAYAAAHPLPATGGPTADGLAFRAHLGRPGLTDAAITEATADGAARRGVAVGRLPGRCRFVVAVRLPGGGVRLIRVGRR